MGTNSRSRCRSLIPIGIIGIGNESSFGLAERIGTWEEYEQRKKALLWWVSSSTEYEAEVLKIVEELGL